MTGEDDAVAKFCAEEMNIAIDNLLVVAQTVGGIEQVIAAGSEEFPDALKIEINAIIDQRVPEGWVSAKW